MCKRFGKHEGSLFKQHTSSIGKHEGSLFKQHISSIGKQESTFMKKSQDESDTSTSSPIQQATLSAIKQYQPTSEDEGHVSSISDKTIDESIILPKEDNVVEEFEGDEEGTADEFEGDEASEADALDGLFLFLRYLNCRYS